MTQDQPQTIYTTYGKNLYRINGSEETDTILNMLNASPNSSLLPNSVTVPADSISSGVNTSTGVQVTGSIQSGKSTYDNTVPGYILGMDPKDGNAKFYIGNTTSYLNWTGTGIFIKATSSNLQIYQTVVNADGTGDYTTVHAALAAGMTRIYVRNGTYNGETSWTISSPNTSIVGESYGGVQITFANLNKITVSATNFYMFSLALTAYSASSNDLILLSSGGVNAVFDTCIIQDDQGVAVNGGGITSYLTLRNCYFNRKTLVNTSAIAISSLNSAQVSNCTFDMTGLMVTNTIIVQSSATTYFTNCTMTTDQNIVYKMTAAATMFFTGCSITGVEFTISGNFIDCNFATNNAADPAAYFVNMTTNSNLIFQGNYVTATTAANLLDCQGHANNIQANIFSGGVAINFDPGGDQTGNIFSGNTWIANNASAAIVVTLNSHCKHGNFIGNVLRNIGGGGETFTDNGSSNNTLYNQLA